jgi:membrane protease YdiL (CAAX protease family)
MDFIKRHRIVVFFVLAYALAWGAIPWNSFFAPGVLLAALIVVTLTEGLSGLKALGARLIRWRVSWVWYALAIGVPLLAHLASAAINVGLGAPPPSLGLLSPWYSLPMAIALHAINPTGGPLMEEPSFRGYAQTELQARRSPMAATAIMAVLVAGWHLPLFFMPEFEAHPIGVVTTMAVTFWYAWLFNHASGSSLLALIAHGTEGAVETSSMWPAGTDLERFNYLYAIVWCVVALALLVFDRAFWTRRPPVDAAPAALISPARDASSTTPSEPDLSGRNRR